MLLTLILSLALMAALFLMIFAAVALVQDRRLFKSVPIIFIFHNLEEVIGFGSWLTKNEKMLAEKYPFVRKVYKNFSTEGFALAVYEEFIVCVAYLAVSCC